MLVPLEVPWDDFFFFRKFKEIFNICGLSRLGIYDILIFTVQLCRVRYTVEPLFPSVGYAIESSFCGVSYTSESQKNSNFQNFKSLKKVYQKNKIEQNDFMLHINVRYTAESPFHGVRYTPESLDQEELFDEKTNTQKSRDTVPLNP